MVFADRRYQRHDKRDKLPGWITRHLREAHLNLSTDMLLHVARWGGDGERARGGGRGRTPLASPMGAGEPEEGLRVP